MSSKRQLIDPEIRTKEESRTLARNLHRIVKERQKAGSKETSSETWEEGMVDLTSEEAKAMAKAFGF